MNAKQFVLGLLLSMVGLLSAQENQQLTEFFGGAGNTPETAEAARDIIELADGNFVIVGKWQGHAFSMKVDPCGRQLWRKQYNIGSESELRDVLVLPDGNLISIGNCTDCVAADTNQNVMALKLSSDGDSIGSFIYDHTLPMRAYSLARQEGGYLAASGSLIGWGTNSFFLRFSENLEIDTFRNYHKGAFESGFDIVATADSGFALCGPLIDSLNAPDGWGWAVIKVNQWGDESWTQRIRSAESGGSGRSAITNSADNSFLIAAGEYVPLGQNESDIKIVTLNLLNGTVMDSVIIGDSTGRDAVYDLKATSNGGFILSGTQPDFLASVRVFDAQAQQILHFSHKYSLYAWNAQSVLPLSHDGLDFVFVGWQQFFTDQDAIWFKYNQIGRWVDLERFPKHFQLYPRDLSLNEGRIDIRGPVISGAPFSNILVDVYRGENFYSSISQPIGTDQYIDLSIDIPAEVENYRLKFYGHENGQRYLEAASCGLVSGDALIIQGQSNAVARQYAGSGTEDLNPFVRVFGSADPTGSDKIWRIGQGDGDAQSPGNTGQWGLRLARQIVTEHDVPVAIFNGAHSGKPISFFQKDSLQPLQATNYGRLYERLFEAGMKDHVRALYWYQGESDAGGQMSTEDYALAFEQLQASWEEDYGAAMEQQYIIQIKPGCWIPDSFVNQIQEAHRRIADADSQVHLMSTTALNHHSDQCHYGYVNGYQKLGDHMYDLTAAHLYGQSLQPNMNAPLPLTLNWVGNQLELTVQNGMILTWEPGAENDFWLEGCSAMVLSGATSGNVLTLEIIGDTTGFTGLSYSGHTGPGSPTIINSNGIGLAGFSTFSVQQQATDIEKLSGSEGIFCYPNPTSDLITLQWPKNLSRFSIQIDLQNSLGQNLLSIQKPPGNETEHLLNLNQYPRGLYIVQLRSGKQLFQKKVWHK